MSEKLRIEEHAGELLSGFIDGELTQQDQQRVQLHVDSCAECSTQVDELRVLRASIGTARLSNVNNDVWRETMNDTAVKASRGIGWILLIGGALLGAGVGVYEIVTSPSSMSVIEKWIVGGIYGGMLLVFISVLRQRLIERKSDRYKDVEI